MVRALFALFLCFSLLFAEEEEPAPLVNLTRQPIPRVFGTVNVISGDWVDQEIHEQPTGPDAPAIGHSYISSHIARGSISNGWEFLWPSKLIRRFVYNPDGTFVKTCLFVREGGGASLRFKRLPSENSFSFDSEDGYTNIASIDNPITRDPYRTKWEYLFKKKTWKATLSDGTIRFYKEDINSRKTGSSDVPDVTKYHLVKEILPSKNIRLYSYGDHYHIKEIKTISSCQKYLIQKITVTKEKNKLVAESLEGKKITFFLKDLGDDETVVSSISRGDAPTRNYEYSENTPHHNTRIFRRTWSTGRVEEAKFYNLSKDMIVDGEKVQRSFVERNLFRNRIQEIRTKRFRGEELFTRNGFFYDKKGNYRYPILNVSEPDDDAFTSFMFHMARIIWLSRYNKKQEKLCSEHFIWSDFGNLKQRVLFDEEKNPLFSKEFIFDSRGFPVTEKNHGIVTSKHVDKLVCKDNVYHSGGETWEEEATWDDEGRLLSRKDPDDNWTYFEYDRSFVTRKVVCRKKHILYREFAKYDTAGNMVEFIQDDSCHKDKENLEGATRRYILKIVPRKKAPHFGEPLSKEHFVWTPHHGCTLKKTEHFHRDEKGRLICHVEKSYEGEKKETRFVYDDLDRIIEKIFPDGSKEKIEYDSKTGLIHEVTKPERRIRYSYDLLQRIISEKVIFPDGTFEEKNYDYNKSGRTVTMRDSRNRLEIIEKDLLDRTVSKTASPILTDKGFVSPVITYSYSGNSVSITSPEGAVVTTLFSSIGKPLEICHPEGRKTTYTYDILGREKERFDGERKVLTDYDDRGHIISIKTYADDTLLDWTTHRFHGDDCVETKTEFLLTTYSYDRFGRCVKKRVLDRTNDKEQVETIEYDGFDRMVRRTTSSGDELFTYDQMDRVLSKKRTSPSGTILLHEKTTYDTAGRVISSSVLKEENSWLTSSTVYGSYGLPSSITAPDGSTVHFSYRQGMHSFIKRTVDPMGIVIEEALSPQNVVTRKTIFSPLGKQIAETRTTYTLLGKPQTISYDVYYKDVLEETIVTALRYDKLGRLISIKEAVGTDEEVSSYKSYDAYSRCVEETKPSGIRILSSYNKKGLLVEKKSSDDTINLSFYYTPSNLLSRVRDHVLHTETTRSYDGFGHLLKESQSNGLVISYGYSDGMMTDVTLPDESSISYRYDGDLLLQAKRKRSDSIYKYTINKRTATGAILETSLPFSLGTVTYTYDSAGRPLSKTQPVASESRTYDVLGRPISRTIDSQTETFQYDDLSQLISDNGKTRSYDSLYRLREKEGLQATVNRRQQCTALGHHRYGYNLDGHRIKDGTAHLVYDALGRLISYTKHDVTEQFEYDGLSRLMRRKTPTSDERYLWMGQHEIGAYDQKGRCLSFRLLAESVGAEGGATIAIELDQTAYACCTDLSGNVRALLDSSGSVAHTATYSAFSRLETTGIDCPFGFFSKRHDDLSSYIFFLYRIYDPVTSSWLTQDPLGLEGGPNLYAYVKNSPLSLFDRLGLFGESFCDACCSIGSAICDFCSSFCDAFSSCVSSACDYISDTASSFGNAVSDTVSSAYDSCCNVASSIGSGISSAWSSFCNHFSSSDPPPAPVASPQGTISRMNSAGEPIDVHAPYGNDKVTLMTKGKSAREIEFMLKYDPTARDKILCMLNGMLTTEKEVIARAEKILTDNRELAAVIIAYNGTINSFVDSVQATATSCHIQISVSRSLADDLAKMFDTLGCTSSDVGITFHCHSEGAGLMRCILHSQGFRQGEAYRGCIGQIYTYGGSVTIPNATNFIARGDVVPFLNPMNWVTMLTHPECVQFVGGWQLPGAAHTFDGQAYQAAFNSTLK